MYLLVNLFIKETSHVAVALGLAPPGNSFTRYEMALRPS